MNTTNKESDQLLVGNRLAAELDLQSELSQVQAAVARFVEQTHPELREMIGWQLGDQDAKYFRPLAVLACAKAVPHDKVNFDQIVQAAAALEIFHNITLIADDIVDYSDQRRGKPSLHARFGHLPAYMAAGYMTAAIPLQLLQNDGYSSTLLGTLMQRLAIAECYQWRVRRKPLAVHDWRKIAEEDTGSMFETAALLGCRDDRLGRFGMLLGVLYHACDDVADVRGSLALGGGGEEDIRDGIVTLPAALAIRDPAVRALFERGDEEDLPAITQKMGQSLPEAEKYLDGIMQEAEQTAKKSATDPTRLLQLIYYTRKLSNS